MKLWIMFWLGFLSGAATMDAVLRVGGMLR